MADSTYEKEKEILERSTLLREHAYAAVEKGTASPSKLAIVDAYPGIKTGFLAGIFNGASNIRLDTEYTLRDLVEIKETGTTTAIKISQDADLQEADRLQRGVQKPQPKMTR